MGLIDRILGLLKPSWGAPKFDPYWDFLHDVGADYDWAPRRPISFEVQKADGQDRVTSANISVERSAPGIETKLSTQEVDRIVTEVSGGLPNWFVPASHLPIGGGQVSLVGREHALLAVNVTTLRRGTYTVTARFPGSNWTWNEREEFEVLRTGYWKHYYQGKLITKDTLITPMMLLVRPGGEKHAVEFLGASIPLCAENAATEQRLLDELRKHASDLPSVPSMTELLSGTWSGGITVGKAEVTPGRFPVLSLSTGLFSDRNRAIAFKKGKEWLKEQAADEGAEEAIEALIKFFAKRALGIALDAGPGVVADVIVRLFESKPLSETELPAERFIVLYAWDAKFFRWVERADSTSYEEDSAWKVIAQVPWFNSKPWKNDDPLRQAVPFWNIFSPGSISKELLLEKAKEVKAYSEPPAPAAYNAPNERGRTRMGSGLGLPFPQLVPYFHRNQDGNLGSGPTNRCENRCSF